ncbi:hypothetical protein KDA_59850 [Dictyobacter alpinus]|uniref:Uncharacterized protein n=1 Tax=Dictyobacter alpinus TaxID=2014873 RepID=A0A402BGG7_9CHLR|nr:hypothetical protein [Dictyobacter alpinus]GCE30501.1 hypothetical protein KDA_59850 [Dictyobacter alpinus]
MFSYNNQIVSWMYLRALMKEASERRTLAASSRRFSWKRGPRLMLRKTGILLMRIGGKLVYWGTPQYSDPVAEGF